LAAGLCPDPLGELERSPDPLAAMRGVLIRGRGREIEEGRGRDEGKEWALPLFESSLRPCVRLSVTLMYCVQNG